MHASISCEVPWERDASHASYLSESAEKTSDRGEHISCPKEVPDSKAWDHVADMSAVPPSHWAQEVQPKGYARDDL